MAKKKVKEYKYFDLQSPEFLEAFRKASEAYTARVKRSKKFARAELVRMGIYLPSGELHPNYRD